MRTLLPSLRDGKRKRACTGGGAAKRGLPPARNFGPFGTNGIRVRRTSAWLLRFAPQIMAPGSKHHMYWLGQRLTQRLYDHVNHQEQLIIAPRVE